MADLPPVQQNCSQLVHHLNTFVDRKCWRYEQYGPVPWRNYKSILYHVNLSTLYIYLYISPLYHIWKQKNTCALNRKLMCCTMRSLASYINAIKKHLASTSYVNLTKTTLGSMCGIDLLCKPIHNTQEVLRGIDFLCWPSGLMLSINPWLSLHKKSMPCIDFLYKLIQNTQEVDAWHRLLVQTKRVDPKHQPMALFAQEVDATHRLLV